VYKYEQVANGTVTISSEDANGSYTIGGASTGAAALNSIGRFTEIGVYSQIRF
jgi:hypothetical protein